MVSVSTIGQSLSQLAGLKKQQGQLSELTMQISSGKKTQTLSGLGTDLMKSIRSRAGVNSLEIYVDNIKNAERRLKLMQTSVNEIKAQARNISSGLSTAVQQGEYPDFATMQATARNVKQFIMSAMNQIDGDRYLFAGGDTSERPIADNGMHASFMGQYVPDAADLTNPPQVASGLIGAWGDGTITTEEFIAAYNDVSDTVLGFSNALTTNTAGKTTVRVNDSAEFDYSTLANKTAMRDIIMMLGVLESLPSVEYAPGALNDPAATTLATDVAPFPPKEKQENFFKVLNDITATLNKAITSLDQETYRLSQVQAQIDIVKKSHTDQINAYKDVIGETEDTDITEASAKLLQVQTQLQASFEVTAMVSRLSLVNYMR